MQALDFGVSHLLRMVATGLLLICFVTQAPASAQEFRLNILRYPSKLDELPYTILANNPFPCHEALQQMRKYISASLSSPLFVIGPQQIESYSWHDQTIVLTPAATTRFLNCLLL